MNINQKGFANIVLIVLVVVVLGGVIAIGYFTFKPNTTPTITQEQAQALILQTWGDCTPDICESVTVTVNNN